MFFYHWLFDGGRIYEEQLDRPQNNFDIAGIPRGKWSSGIFACYKNLLPSCILSFFCPWIIWGQIVIRSQIPLLIATKNSIRSMRGRSGYSFFVNTFFIVSIILAGLIIGSSLVERRADQVLLISLTAIVFLFLMFVLGHVRTAFKQKYAIPSMLPHGSEVWDCLLDAVISTFCLPCSLAQMARHVFQYDHWTPPLGFYVKDPTSLPSLEYMAERPRIADEAGIFWTEDVAHPDATPHTGAAHRPSASADRHPHVQDHTPLVHDPIIAVAEARPISPIHSQMNSYYDYPPPNSRNHPPTDQVVYRPDGSIVRV